MTGPCVGVPPEFLPRIRRGLRDRYEVRRVIGWGGMSVIFLARTPGRRRSVAIKVLRPELVLGIGVERFLREVRVESTLDHPNIVPLLEVGEVDGLPFCVMPYVDGESLRDRLLRTPQLRLNEALSIIRDVGRALSAAHAREIIHRDIKPANILLGPGGAQVADFGIARALDEAIAVPLGSTGLAAGTPGYMSPEQGAAEVELCPAADQYSLACVAHEMLAGEPLFCAATTRVLIFKHAALPPPPIRGFRPELPSGLEGVLLTALSKTPGDRFSSVDEFVESLEASASGELDEKYGDPGRTRREQIAHGLEKAVLEHPARLASGVLTFGGALIVASILLTLWLFSPGLPDWVDGRPESVAVLPNTAGLEDPLTAEVAGELADLVARELDQLGGMEAVGLGPLADLIRSLDMSTSGMGTTGEGLTITREAGMQALLEISVQLQGEQVFAEAALYESESGRLIGEGVRARGLVGELPAIATDLASRLLASSQEDAEDR